MALVLERQPVLGFSGKCKSIYAGGLSKTANLKPKVVDWLRRSIGDVREIWLDRNNSVGESPETEEMCKVLKKENLGKLELAMITNNVSGFAKICNERYQGKIKHKEWQRLLRLSCLFGARDVAVEILLAREMDYSSEHFNPSWVALSGNNLWLEDVVYDLHDAGEKISTDVLDYCDNNDTYGKIHKLLYPVERVNSVRNKM